jgi:hypothetical protein
LWDDSNLTGDVAAALLQRNAIAAMVNVLARGIAPVSDFSVLQGAAGKDLQPERFEQSHAQDVLVFVTDGDVVKENSFQLVTNPAVEIVIAHVDVARVDVNLV